MTPLMGVLDTAGESVMSDHTHVLPLCHHTTDAFQCWKRVELPTVDDGFSTLSPVFILALNYVSYSV